MESVTENKYFAKNFEYKIEDLNKVVYNLDRFTVVNSGELLEDLDGEFVKIEDVVNLFAAKTK